MRVAIIQPRRERFDNERFEFWEFGFMAKAAGNFRGLRLTGSNAYKRRYSGTPLALATLSALLPADAESILIDENVEPIDFDLEVDLVLLSFFTAAATRGYQIADRFRNKNVCVVIGGIHASMLPDEAIKHADAVAIGEAEPILLEIIEDFRNGRLKMFYRVREADRPSLANTPTPHWHRLKLNRYFNPTMQTMRGCPMSCEFCTVRIQWGPKYRYKLIDKVVEEIDHLKRTFGQNTFIMICDDDIAASRERSKELFRALIPLNVRWMGQGSIAMASDNEFLQLMTQSGGTRIIIGLESISEVNLREMRKNPANRIERYEADIRKINSAGVAIIGAFVLGFDHDNLFSFENTADFIVKNHIAFPQLICLTPFPGTALAQRLEKAGRILSKDWKMYVGSIVNFAPKLMSPEELQDGYYYAIQKVYSYKSIHDRLSGLFQLWENESAKPAHMLLKDEIDVLLVNENFRGVAYSYPLRYHADEHEERAFEKILRCRLHDLLKKRAQTMSRERGVRIPDTANTI